MGNLPIKGIISNAASGSSADGQIYQTAWDNALGPMAPNMLAYLRAGRLNATGTQLIDALGNPLVGANNSSFNAVIANFNGDWAMQMIGTPATPYQYPANGLGPTKPPGPMTASFTMVTSIHTPASLITANYLMSDDTGGNGAAMYFDGSGTLHFDANTAGSSFEGSYAAGLAVSTVYVLWWSYDSATKISRIGWNNATVQSQTTGTHTHAPSSATTLFPFGLFTGGGATTGQFNRWILFNKAYLNGASATDDQIFTNMLATAFTQVG